jgi:hypothetical protein
MLLCDQEDAVDYKLSVYTLFSELFPEFCNTGVSQNQSPFKLFVLFSYRLTARAKRGVGSLVWLADALLAEPML